MGNLPPDRALIATFLGRGLYCEPPSLTDTVAMHYARSTPKKTEKKMKKFPILSVLTCVVSMSIFAQSANERKFIRKGNSESEVLAKVGKPDSESVISGARGPVVKQWIYLPHVDDQQTVTTFTLREGTVVEIDRKVIR